ncbi:MAG: sigma-54-dependent Fis family transcriptional regulator [Candidatus Riflebacteria bacterium]|nr:sigma-54-dependent Fis family transcriptional regulator [Candidatus Riflebacteria bacterium]
MDEVSILVVDDEFSVRDSLFNWFRKDGHKVAAAANATEALSCLQKSRYDVVFLDIKMPGMDGMALQERIHQIDPTIAIIMLTAFASVDTAVRAMKQGAFDYVTKPIDPDELSHLVRRATEQQRLQRENAKLRETIEEMSGGDVLIGESPGMQKVLELIGLVAQTDATVLVRGESGTGKELVARAIHVKSQRRYFPIVPVNCGAFQETMLESELFGHEKGAFTGALYRRKGKLEMASGGTLFLDEVGTISPKMQIDLLRVLEAKEFARLGGNTPVKVDFRVICATNEDLEKSVKAGSFREDLYYRINVFSLEIPPLRSRQGDIPLLARHFVDRFARQMDKRLSDISPAAMERLLAHTCPGNVRELANAIERAMVVGKPPHILPQDLPILSASAPDGPDDDSLATMEKRHIAAVLERNGWNIKRAAEKLQIDRATLYNKIARYRLRGTTDEP